MKDWTVWLKGIAAAVIGGGASAVAAAIGAPQMFSASRGNLEALLKVGAVAAVLNAAAYLKQSPLPTKELEK